MELKLQATPRGSASSHSSRRRNQVGVTNRPSTSHVAQSQSREGSDRTSDSNVERKMQNRIRDKVSRCSADVNLELQRASNDGVLSYETMRTILHRLNVPLADEEFNYLKSLSHNEHGDTRLEKVMNTIRTPDFDDYRPFRKSFEREKVFLTQLARKELKPVNRRELSLDVHRAVHHSPSVSSHRTSNSLSSLDGNQADPSSSKTLLAFVNNFLKHWKSWRRKVSQKMRPRDHYNVKFCRTAGPPSYSTYETIVPVHTSPHYCPDWKRYVTVSLRNSMPVDEHIEIEKRKTRKMMNLSRRQELREQMRNFVESEERFYHNGYMKRLQGLARTRVGYLDRMFGNLDQLGY
ncbi:hypothetical protein GUITHDRAFT_165130 [Guillardia theta CCMP2712]|uniref:Uncharacterized protein n=1 Tax=Guillardia theta (strain CCMP2712) TaxID=905079 RepID=L1ISM4_GUITC|nr:hypothetical protein GUITHDRAFT_165130 [Guillardia theta CCMP2712]EKX38815.1 hypothetical protein GUITHDRAFT_165130 [Guillardia theta CCMP2712]|eukprot:XP_005825795.1 hypothetical protein GUITHDRAFT_165130 [Guillardia theta CCMP2712]